MRSFLLKTGGVFIENDRQKGLMSCRKIKFNYFYILALVKNKQSLVGDGVIVWNSARR